MNFNNAGANQAKSNKVNRDKRVIVRYYASTNLGDDLFIHILASRYSNIFYIDHLAQKRIFKDYPNLKPSSNLARYLLTKLRQKRGRQVPMLSRENLKNGDLYLYIGGSIFMENASLEKWGRERDQYLALEMPYYILGSNFGPYVNREFKGIIGDIVSHSIDTCFRDNASYREFEDFETARVSTDLAFTLSPSKAAIQPKRRIAVLSVIDTGRRFKEETVMKYEELMSKIAVKLIDEGYHVKLMSFCKKEGDEDAVRRIGALIPQPLSSSTSSYYYRGALRESLNILEEAEIIVGSRFHSVILGMLFGAKVLPVSYSNKTVNILNDMDYEGPLVDILNIDTFDLDSFTTDSLVIQDVSYQIELAQTQFKELDKVLQRK